MESDAAQEQRRAYWTRICRSEFGVIVQGTEDLGKAVERTIPLFYDDPMSQKSIDDLLVSLEDVEALMKGMTGRIERLRYHLAEHARTGKLVETT